MVAELRATISKLPGCENHTHRKSKEKYLSCPQPTSVSSATLSGALSEV